MLFYRCFFVILHIMIAKTEAIVLHSFKYGEQKLVVDMFTRDHGRLTFMVPLPKSAKGRLKKQYFQPLTPLTVAYDYRPSLQFQKLTDAGILQPLSSIQTSPSKLAISMFVAEFLYHALKGEQQNDPLFAYLCSAIEWLDGRPSQYANFHLAFLIHLSRFLGFYPNLDGYEAGSYFDLRAGTFCTAPPPHHDLLQPAEAAMMQTLMRMDFATMHLFRMNRQQRAQLLDVALRYYRLHLPDFPQLRSVEVLKELFE